MILEQTMNQKALTAPPRNAARPRPRVSDRLAKAIDDAAAGPRDTKGRLVRNDGWTPERIRVFLEALADLGTVEDAARVAGMSRSSAYAFRRREEGRAFAEAWDGAVLLARPVLADALMSRAMHGCVELIVRDGEVWGERHRFDNRHAMAMLTRLDQKALAADDKSVTARLVAGAFDAFVDIVCAGGGEAADAFLQSRAEAGPDGTPQRFEIVFVRPKPQ
jgi:hypothetical protein